MEVNEHHFFIWALNKNLKSKYCVAQRLTVRGSKAFFKRHLIVIHTTNFPVTTLDVTFFYYVLML